MGRRRKALESIESFFWINDVLHFAISIMQIAVNGANQPTIYAFHKPFYLLMLWRYFGIGMRLAY
jgi:hypothetical protein